MFLDVLPPLQTVIHRKHDTFGEWATRNYEKLFQAVDIENNFEFTGVLHFIMKRLKQPYSEIMMMDTETRKAIFKLEYDIYKKELEENQKASRKK